MKRKDPPYGGSFANLIYYVILITMKVTIFGWNHPDDMIFADEYTKNDLQITWRMPTNQYKEGTDEWKSVWNECIDSDLVLIAAFGNCSSYWLDKIDVYEPIFKSIKRVAHWSFDSHHDVSECLLRKYFTHWLVAHDGYEQNTGPNTIHLPLCYWQYGYNDYKTLIENAPHSADVVYHHNRYMIGNREELVEKIISIMERSQLTYNFNACNNWLDYSRSIEGCKVGLNISLLEDLNFRNFEVWMANKPLLTNRLKSHDYFPELSAQTTFFERDLSNFEEKLHDALSKQVDTRKLIIKNHMITQRYLEGINAIMGTSYKVSFPE
jgi:hypothetical protein